MHDMALSELLWSVLFAGVCFVVAMGFALNKGPYIMGRRTIVTLWLVHSAQWLCWGLAFATNAPLIAEEMSGAKVSQLFSSFAMPAMLGLPLVLVFVIEAVGQWVNRRP